MSELRTKELVGRLSSRDSNSSFTGVPPNPRLVKFIEENGKEAELDL